MSRTFFSLFAICCFFNTWATGVAGNGDSTSLTFLQKQFKEPYRNHSAAYFYSHTGRPYERGELEINTIFHMPGIRYGLNNYITVGLNLELYRFYKKDPLFILNTRAAYPFYDGLLNIGVSNIWIYSSELNPWGYRNVEDQGILKGIVNYGSDDNTITLGYGIRYDIVSDPRHTFNWWYDPGLFFIGGMTRPLNWLVFYSENYIQYYTWLPSGRLWGFTLTGAVRFISRNFQLQMGLSYHEDYRYGKHVSYMPFIGAAVRLK